MKRPGAPLRWYEKCQVAFDELRHRFTTEPVLKHVDPDKPCMIQVDSSDVAMGAVILQRDGKGRLHPIAFLSKKFSEMERNWAIWEKEAAAIKLALSTWRHWLEGSPQTFEVWSGNKNLLALHRPCKLSAKQIR